MPQHAHYDGILLGAGHNSLVLQAYLGRAGLKTVCLERAERPGGGLATTEDPRWPGFRHNTHSFFHRALDQMPWYRELDLARRGAKYLEPELNVALVLRDGEPLCWWTDFEKTAQSFARFSSRDAARLRYWRDAFQPILEKILGPEARRPPLPASQRKQHLEKTPEGRLLLETSLLSPLEFVEREFEDPVVRAGLLFFNGLREVDLRLRGFGHHIPMLLASPAKAQMCLGGSERLADALVTAVKDYGGKIRTGCTPRRIVVEGGKVIGVETEQGELIRGGFVASSLNPQQTFNQLLSEKDAGISFQKAKGFEYNLLAPLFALNLVLKNPPQYKRPELDDAFMVILGLEHYAQFHDIVRHHEAGTIPPTVMWGACPTRFDPSQAPAGGHVAFMWEKLPYRLHGDPASWDRERDRHGEEMLRLWTEYAPNLANDVTGWFTRSPLDTERSLPNMKEGDLLVGAFSNGQVGYDRPFAGAGQYRTPVDGLYLCGSSSHPGGNITGLPGYNSAQVILEDLGLTKFRPGH